MLQPKYWMDELARSLSERSCVLGGGGYRFALLLYIIVWLEFWSCVVFFVFFMFIDHDILENYLT